MASVDELWLVDFGDPYPGEPAHHRPALVVGPSTLMGGVIPAVIVVPLTSRRRGVTNHVEIEATERSGLDLTSYAQCELVRGIGARRLVHRLGWADPGEVAAVRHMLAVLLSL